MLRRLPHRTPASLSIAALSIVAAGCGPAVAPPPQRAEVAVAAPGSAVASAAVEAPPEVPPAPEPDELMMVMRVGAPLRDLALWRDLLPAHTTTGQVLSLGPSGMADVAFGSLAEHLDLEAPLDVIVLEGGPSIVVSVAVRDPEGLRRSQGFTFRAARDGSTTVRPREGSPLAGMIGRAEATCSMFQVAGVEARLVCATEPESVEVAAPYLVRTLGRRPAADGIRFELPEKALAGIMDNAQEALTSETSDLEDANARAGEEAGRKIAMTFANDFRSLGADIAASGAGVTIGLDARLRSMKSPFSLAVAGRSSVAVPATFWSLPVDTDAALFMPGADPAAMRAATADVWAALGGSLAEEDEEGWKLAEPHLKALFATGGPLTIARGAAGIAAKRAGKAAPEPKTPAQIAKKHAEDRLDAAGWTLITAPESAAAWEEHLTAIDKIPSSKKAKKPKKEPRTKDKTTLVPVRATEGLPKGSLHFVTRSTPNPAYVPDDRKPAVVAVHEDHTFVSGTAEHVWIAFSENEKLARTKLLEAMAGSPAFGQRADLAALRQLPAGAIGFTSMRAMLDWMRDADTPDQLATARASRQEMDVLPYLGTSPIFLSITSRPDAEGGTTVRLTGQLSIAAFVDLVQYLQTVF